jgi:prepilin-type N-terminal cleavage/methylation domain-containing protein
MKQRKAFTLVELLMTMTMGSSLMLLAIGLVHQSMSMSKLAKIRGDHDRTLARLAQQFRSDIHRATELVSVSNDAVKLKLVEESYVTYKRDAAIVTRELMVPTGVEARELFRFDEWCTATFSSQSVPLRIRLQVERKLEHSEIPLPVDLRVEAVVGRWQTLENQVEHSGGDSP